MLHAPFATQNCNKKDGKIARLPAAGAADHSGRPGAGRKGDAAYPRRAGGGVRTRALSGLIVALDPGHGGYDGGARAQDSGRWEKDVALEIALEVEKALLARGAQVVLTRREDVCLADGDTASKTRKREDLQKRIDIAEAADADVLLSIHLNEYRSREESGPQVFYQHGSDQGRLLAGTLQQALLDGLKPSRERSALAGDYYVLGGTMPSVLVECGFLSNPREEALLLDPAYQQQIGQAIADGLEAYEVLLARTGQEDAA